MKNVLLKTIIMALIAAFALSGSFAALGFLAPVTTSTFDASWRLKIDGAVTTPLTLSISDLQTMFQVSVPSPLFCGGVLVTDGTWSGVQIETLLQAAGADPTAPNLEFYASDGYKINVASSYAFVNNPIVAYELNGQPMGDSLRLVLPDQPGNFWIALITEIKVSFSDTYSIGPVAFSGSGGSTSSGGSGNSGTSGTQTQPTESPQTILTPPPSISTPTAPPVTAHPSLTLQPSQTSQPTKTPQQTQAPTPNETASPISPTQAPIPTPSATASPLGNQPSQQPLSSGSGSPLTLEVLAIAAIVAVGAATAGFLVFMRKKSTKVI